MTMFDLEDCCDINIQNFNIRGVVLSFDGKTGEAIKPNGEVIKLSSIDDFNNACDKAAKGIL